MYKLSNMSGNRYMTHTKKKVSRHDAEGRKWANSMDRTTFATFAWAKRWKKYFLYQKKLLS